MNWCKSESADGRLLICVTAPVAWDGDRGGRKGMEEQSWEERGTRVRGEGVEEHIETYENQRELWI